MTRNRMKFGLVGIATMAALTVGLLVATQAWAAVHATLGVGSNTLTPGSQGTVSVTTNVPSPGLGAWTVDVIVADPSHVSIVGCTAPTGSVCNPNYPGSLPTVRFAGASATGLTGPLTLGTVTVRCAATEGSSALNLSTVGFADGTVGDPQEIAVTFSPGTIRCATAPTAAAAATSTPVVRAIPSTGTGGAGGGNSFAWLMAALAAVGVTGLASYGALRLRSARR